MINHECCVCYSSTEDIEPAFKNSFITIPCGGNHVMCFSCFMRNASTKCPMCRFNYKTMRHDRDEPAFHSASEVNETFEPNEDLAFIDNWWRRLNYMIPNMLPVIQNEVFRKWLHITNTRGNTIDFEWTSDAIAYNTGLADNIIDLEDNYDMCCRMYLTRILVAYNEQQGDDYTEFVSAVNDFIQHEYDNM